MTLIWGLLRGAAVALVLFNATACKRGVAQPPSQGDAGPASEVEAPQAWSDPRVIAELVKSCAFDPDKLPEAQRSAWTGSMGPGNTSVMTCKAAFEQSCVYDPCFTSQEDTCKPRCTSECGACGAQCVARCDECKRGCRDATCRTSCAQGCASCRETCVRTRNRCATGTCTAEYQQCRVKLKNTWLSKGCARACKRYPACAEACPARMAPRDENKAANAASERCDKACRARAPSCDFDLCPSDNGMGIDPTEVR